MNNTIDYANMWNLGKLTTGGNVYVSDRTSTACDINFNYKPEVRYEPPEDLYFKGQKFRIDDIEMRDTSLNEVTEITIRGHKINTFPTGFTGCSGTITIDDPEFINDFKKAFNPYAIKKVVANPKKNATTVIFEDGTVEVVKKSPDDPEADIFSVVAYAVAKRIYGSNSAFKREVLKNIDFIGRDFDSIVCSTPIEDLAKMISKIANNLKVERTKE